MAMSIRPIALGGIALLFVLGLSPGWAQQTPPPEQTPPPAETAPAQETAPAEQPAAEVNCADCHDEHAKAFTTNPHAKELTCEVCHDGGSAHAEAGGDTSLVTVPRGFAGAQNTCLTCHDRTTDRRSHRMGAHANSQAVNCLSCHSIHKAADPMHLVALPQPQLCATCHGPQAASFRNRPHTHRLGTGAMGCTTCHDPHARPGRENIRVTTAGETTCLGCHTDKRGPFVFQHAGTAVGEADCSSCHEPHGSSNPNQLKRARVAQVCLECHSPLTSVTLASQPPSFHNLNNPRYQNCTTCHVAVHGSNRSPQLLK